MRNGCRGWGLACTTQGTLFLCPCYPHRCMASRGRSNIDINRLKHVCILNDIPHENLLTQTPSWQAKTNAHCVKGGNGPWDTRNCHLTMVRAHHHFSFHRRWWHILTHGRSSNRGILTCLSNSWTTPTVHVKPSYHSESSGSVRSVTAVRLPSKLILLSPLLRLHIGQSCKMLPSLWEPWLLTACSDAVPGAATGLCLCSWWGSFWPTPIKTLQHSLQHSTWAPSGYHQEHPVSATCLIIRGWYRFEGKTGDHAVQSPAWSGDSYEISLHCLGFLMVSKTSKVTKPLVTKTSKDRDCTASPGYLFPWILSSWWKRSSSCPVLTIQGYYY